jgi:hypothetical protein
MRQSAAFWISMSILIASALAAGLVVRPLIFPDPAETWLEVEAPILASRDAIHRIVVRLAKPVSGTFLRADLHGQDSSGRYLGYLTGSAAVAVDQGRREYAFDIGVPEEAGLGSVQGVIYLSRLGSWESRISTALLEPVPIRVGGSIEDLRPRPVKVLSIVDRLEPVREESLPLRIAAGLAWAACALLCLRRSREEGSAAAALACLCACAWELLMPEPTLSELARRAFESEGLYGLRREPQVLVSLAAVAAGLVGALLIARRWIWRGRRARGLAWLGLYAYACLALLRIVSEHDIDALLAKPLAGIQSGQAARLAFSALALAALIAGRLSSRRR